MILKKFLERIIKIIKLGITIKNIEKLEVRSRIETELYRILLERTFEGE